MDSPTGVLSLAFLFWSAAIHRRFAFVAERLFFFFATNDCWLPFESER